MTNLTWDSLKEVNTNLVAVPDTSHCYLPEKILQFGTGVLLRGLPDYYVDQANRKDVFQGRIVAVKSTSRGPLQAFDRQNGLYTLTVRGNGDEAQPENNIIISSISRVLSAASAWDEVLACSANPGISIVISNTTEAGLQLLRESIHQQPPTSFPAKLLACLYQRFRALGHTPDSSLVIVPTELIPDNGTVLRNIVLALAEYNTLGRDFFDWLKSNIHFCNSLVDRIVPGQPDKETKNKLEKAFNYHDDLLITSESYNMWAIEGDEQVASKLTFHQSNAGIIITPDINLYRELKLRLLNGTHTLCSGVSFLAGIDTVFDATAHRMMSSYVRQLMFDEIALAIPYPVPKKTSAVFAEQTYDRFCNTNIRHSWLNITSQYTMKMKMRVIPILLKYYEQYHQIPERIAFGFAAYLLFMKATYRKEDQFFAENNGKCYPIHDDHAAYFYRLWKQFGDTPDELVEAVLSNKALWGSDLTSLPGFTSTAKERLRGILRHGILNKSFSSITTFA